MTNFSLVLVALLAMSYIHSDFGNPIKRKSRGLFPALIKGGAICIEYILDLGGCSEYNGGVDYDDYGINIPENNNDISELLPPNKFPGNTHIRPPNNNEGIKGTQLPYGGQMPSHGYSGTLIPPSQIPNKGYQEIVSIYGLPNNQIPYKGYSGSLGIPIAPIPSKGYPGSGSTSIIPNVAYAGHGNFVWPGKNINLVLGSKLPPLYGAVVPFYSAIPAPYTSGFPIPVVASSRPLK